MESYESTTRRMKPEKPGLCALIQDMLPFYLEGDVSPQSRQFVENHLEECERCASFLAGGQSVQAHFRREAGTRSVVMRQDRPAQHLIASGRRRLIGHVLTIVGGLALLVLAFGVLSGILNGSPSPATAFPSFGPTVVPPLVESWDAPAPTQAAEILPTVELPANMESQPTPTPWPTRVPAP